ncbi:MAG: Uma2 family endonuclease [Microcystaceae cyanobacterium]
MVNLVDLRDRLLPTAEQLPCSDETPVDNQLQNDIPNLLLYLLSLIWKERQDWYFGVDMGVYYNPDEAAIIPDGFLALGVQRQISEKGRLSYLLWAEPVPPILVLEVISERYNGEYEEKLLDYQTLGFLYYVIYNPFSGRRGRHRNRQRLEIYRLIAGKYELLTPESHWFWLPEIGLGLGYEVGEHLGWEREWLYWYERSGTRYLTAVEQTERALIFAQRERLTKQQAEVTMQEERLAKQEAEAIAVVEKQRGDKLADYLRSLGINPDEI